ncbi:Uncharacterised protein [Bordetella pertussis]|nr:Uncharacterised protein [Bordetella pertussis]CFP58439.1 Uncharacterised protein [Bordetella pertussis]
MFSARLPDSQRRPRGPRSLAGPHCSLNGMAPRAGLPTGAGMSIARPSRFDSIEISTAPPFR